MHTKKIKEELNENIEHKEISRKIYLSYPTKVFIGIEDSEYDILNKISEYFRIPLYNVHVAGSAKTGYSYYKSKEFIAGESDLDIAIIDSNLFIKYVDIVSTVTKGFKDKRRFNYNKYPSYCNYIASGIFRPDLMPRCKEKSEWFSFFNKLSGSYYELFKDINAGIYATQSIFEERQARNFNILRK